MLKNRGTSANVRKNKKKRIEQNGSVLHDANDVENQCEVEDTKYMKHRYQRLRFIFVLLVGGTFITFTFYFLYIYLCNTKVTTARKGEEQVPIAKQETLEKVNNIYFQSSQKHKNSTNHRWSDPKLLPPLPDEDIETSRMMQTLRNRDERRGHNKRKVMGEGTGFRNHYGNGVLEWELDIDRIERDLSDELRKRPLVDYTTLEYHYIDVMYSLPPSAGDYPQLLPLGQIMKLWPQDDIDFPPKKINERLLHFDYMDPQQRAAAIEFRDSELPFKVYNVPELEAAGRKWTDEYLIEHFDHIHDVRGTCQEVSKSLGINS